MNVKFNVLNSVKDFSQKEYKNDGTVVFYTLDSVMTSTPFRRRDFSAYLNKQTLEYIADIPEEDIPYWQAVIGTIFQIL